MRLLVLCFLATAVLGQQVKFDPSFDVVAIHPVGPDVRVGSQFTSTEFSINAITVRQLIQMSYGLVPVRLKGRPGWIDTERFSVRAGAAGIDLTQEENLFPRLRNLLAERFGLKMHSETQQQRSYAIVVRDPSKIRPTKDAAPTGSITPSGADELQVSLRNYAIGMFTTPLSNLLQAVVKDETGIIGGFDFEGVIPRSPNPYAPLDTRPLLEQHGLRLEPRQGPVEIYTIEAVERPSEN